MRRIDKMGTDIFEQLLDKLRAGESFSLQLDELDESVDVSGAIGTIGDMVRVSSL